MNRKRLVASIGAIAIVALIAFAFLVKVDGVPIWKRTYLVYQARDIVIAPNSTGPVTLYSLGFLKPSPIRVQGAEEVFSDFAQVGTTKIAITRDSKTFTPQVLLLGSQAHVISTEIGEKTGLAISPDGNLIAYSFLASSTAPTQSLSAWHLKVVNLKTGESTDTGDGVDAQFFTRDGKVWLLSSSAAGIRLTDLDNLTSVTTPMTHADDRIYSAKISPDGMHIAMRDPATRLYSVYHIPSIEARVLLPIQPTGIVLRNFNDVILTDTAWFGTRLTAEDSELHLQIVKMTYTPDSTGTILYSFPARTSYHFVVSRTSL